MESYFTNCFPLVCNFYSIFMIHIISDYKTNIKHVFTLLESYFINNGEDIVPLICNISDEMEILFYELEHVSALFAIFIIVS